MSNSNQPEAETTSTTETETDATCSQKQLAANRANAEKSTGPRSAAGKRRSAGNSTLHGLYQEKLGAIRYGRFAEDPDQVADFIAAVIDNLGPRDVLEAAQAERVARAVINANRLDVFEVAGLERDTVLGAPTTTSPETHDSLDGIVDVLNEVVSDTNYLSVPLSGAGWLEVTAHRPWVRWQHLAVYVRVNAFERPIRIRDMWDETREPGTEKEWRAALLTLLKHKFASPAAASEWVRGRAVARCQRDRDGDAQADGAAAARALDETMVKVARLRAASERSLASALTTYGVLRARDFGTD